MEIKTSSEAIMQTDIRMMIRFILLIFFLMSSTASVRFTLCKIQLTPGTTGLFIPERGLSNSHGGLNLPKKRV